MNKIHVIGIGYRPFDTRSGRIVRDADVILASKRLFEVFRGYEEFATVKDRVMEINRIDELMDYIRNNSRDRKIVLLASGDPLFFGIGRKVLSEFGTERVEMLPDLSSIQIAFARIGRPWDDAFLMSLHGGPDPEKRRRLPYEIDDIPSLLEAHDKIAILTDRENNPSVIAMRLNSPEFPMLRLSVCERLGYPDEKVTSGTAEEIAGMIFREPNVVIVMKGAEKQKTGSAAGKKEDDAFGLTEGEISHSRGLITKDEVRAVAIHRLRLPQRGVLWDIGAGSGSISIEAARLCPGLRVYAVERDNEQLGHIEENKARFGTANIAITSGEAPDALRDLPSPDRVFIGGSGGNLSVIIRRIREKMPRGIVVINAVTLDTLNEAVLILENNGFEPEISEISVSRSKVLKGQRHLAALNPVFVIRGERK